MKHTHTDEVFNLKYIVFSGIMLVLGIFATAFGCTFFLKPYVSLVWYLVAFLPIGFPIVKKAIHLFHHNFIVGEHMLMSLAALGAFCLGEYAEGVAVILLYSIGELLQDKAVDKAKGRIRAMLALKPKQVRVVENGERHFKKPNEVEINTTIEVFAGEQLPLDGVLLSSQCAFNTAALTGESVPKTLQAGNEVLAGMIAIDGIAQVKVLRKESQSAIARILKMVEEASERKAPTEKFIRRFAKVYTPTIAICAALIALLPWFYSFVNPSFLYHPITWIRHALLFLVVSCPCALVVSVPLSYFMGMGIAAKYGVLLKGSGFLDALSSPQIIAFDKTGTLTTGSFIVKQVHGLTPEQKNIVANLEAKSVHPVAKTIAKTLFLTNENIDINAFKEVSGRGIEAQVNNENWLIGTLQFMLEHHIVCPESTRNEQNTLVLCAVNKQLVGYIVLEDALKPDSVSTITELKTLGTEKIIILSGDKKEVVETLKTRIGADEAYGELLPNEKMEHLERVKKEGKRVFFVGDGINDAPVLAVSDVAIAMGKQGSDMAIETADVVLQADKPSQLITIIKLAKQVKQVVHFNVFFSISIKMLILAFSFFGFESLWLAIFADSGVALLTVLVAVLCFSFKGKQHKKA